MASNSSYKAAGKLRLRIATLALGMAAFASLCYAKNDCPWMNEATASGLLGGDANGEFTAAAAGQPAVCQFTQKDATATRALRITVLQTLDSAATYQSAAQTCGADAAPLPAIGNQAVACAMDDRKGAPGERAVGRVRDQVFTIAFTTSLKADPVFSRAMLQSKIYTAAEQVSGNLF